MHCVLSNEITSAGEIVEYNISYMQIIENFRLYKRQIVRNYITYDAQVFKWWAFYPIYFSLDVSFSKSYLHIKKKVYI